MSAGSSLLPQRIQQRITILLCCTAVPKQPARTHPLHRGRQQNVSGKLFLTSADTFQWKDFSNKNDDLMEIIQTL